jgi:hypothetical protein
MTREAIIKRTVTSLQLLPVEKIEEIADFTDYVLKRHEEMILQNGIQKLAEESGSFDFLKEDEDLYTIDDIKEKY